MLVYPPSVVVALGQLPFPASAYSGKGGCMFVLLMAEVGKCLRFRLGPQSLAPVCIFRPGPETFSFLRCAQLELKPALLQRRQFHQLFKAAPMGRVFLRFSLGQSGEEDHLDHHPGSFKLFSA